MVSSSTGTLKRFYERATISQAPAAAGCWHVLLDGKRVKTPRREPLLVPSQVLAMAIAAEFQYQSKDYVRPITQPLFRLQWQVQDAAFARQELVDRLLQFVDDDPMCLRQPEHGFGARVARRQRQLCDPILDWARARFRVPFATTSALYAPDQAPEVSLAYVEYLAALPYAQLLALAEAAGACKSLLLGFALHAGQVTIAQAVAAARIEEDVQLEAFGLVEGGHDLDIVDLRTRVAGCAIFMRMHAVDAGLQRGGVDEVRRDVDKALRNLESLGL